MSSVVGVPSTEIIRWTWSRKSSPGKSGCLPNSSARIHPTDQISTAFVYSLALRMTSGARYHLVTTYSVFSSYSWTYPRANPRSQIWRSQLLFWMLKKIQEGGCLAWGHDVAHWRNAWKAIPLESDIRNTEYVRHLVLGENKLHGANRSPWVPWWCIYLCSQSSPQGVGYRRAQWCCRAWKILIYGRVTQ
jgi:hypothetical protein